MQALNHEQVKYHDTVKICKEILDSHLNIRSVSMSQQDGVIDYMVHRKDDERLTTHQEGVSSLVQATVRFHNRVASTQGKFGKILFSLTVHEKVARVTMPILQQAIHMSFDKDADYLGMITNHVYPIIKKWEKKMQNLRN
ncbi:MAG: hypothetical protein EPO62_03505 [Candidatus Nitrosotenuis sp.]|nr:MAG: hypothetical protein EPO62_03505 [Candidatus Nitrosotenuis sp.]